MLVSQAGSFAKAMMQVYQQLRSQQACAAPGADGSDVLSQCISLTPHDLCAWIAGLKRCAQGS